MYNLKFFRYFVHAKDLQSINSKNISPTNYTPNKFVVKQPYVMGNTNVF